MSFLKCRRNWEMPSKTGRRQMFGTSSVKARKRIWKYELVTFMSISTQILKVKEKKVTGTQSERKNSLDNWIPRMGATV